MFKTLLKWIGIGFLLLMTIGAIMDLTGNGRIVDSADDIKVDIAKQVESADDIKVDIAKQVESESYANSPERKVERFVSQVRTNCMEYTRDSSKYPSKVDFDWLGGSENYWMNFNSEGDSRVKVGFTGEMMNGIGLMVPFEAVCTYNYNPETGKSVFVDFLIR